MQTTLNIKNTRGGAIGKEKTICILLGMAVYFISFVTEKALSLVSLKTPAKRSKRSAAREASSDKDTTVANLCAFGVAIAVAAVVYVTMLFCVGEGYRNGIGAEIAVSSVMYVLVYKTVSFLTLVD